MRHFERDRGPRFPRPQVIGATIGNRIEDPFLDRKERAQGLLGKLVENHEEEDFDTQGNMIPRHAGLSISNTPNFNQLYAYIANRIENYTPEQFEGRVKGHLFAHLAKAELSARTKAGVIMADETETLDFVAKVEGVSLSKDERGVEFAVNTYAPDGMVIAQTIDGSHILAFIEYSTHPGGFKFRDQLYGFRALRDKIGLAQTTDFLVVIPETEDDGRNNLQANLRATAGLSEAERDHIKVLTTSFSVHAFNKYARFVIDGYIDPVTKKTLGELFAERRLPEISLGRRDKKRELRRRINGMFEDGKLDDLQYVLQYGLKRERKISSKTGVIDLRSDSKRPTGLLVKIA